MEHEANGGSTDLHAWAKRLESQSSLKADAPELLQQREHERLLEESSREGL